MKYQHVIDVGKPGMRFAAVKTARQVALIATFCMLLAACAAPATDSPATSAPVIQSPTAAQTQAAATVAATTATATQASPPTSTPPAMPTFQLVSTLEATPMSPEPTSPPPQDSYQAGLVDTATRDLAGRLNVPPAEIEFVEFESVVWPDGGLGCPEPGMMYTQVQVEGFRINLRHKGQVYSYHGSSRRPPFLCEKKS